MRDRARGGDEDTNDAERLSVDSAMRRALLGGGVAGAAAPAFVGIEIVLR